MSALASPAAAVSLLALLLALSPLLGAATVEGALAHGLLLPPVLAALVARRTCASRRDGAFEPLASTFGALQTGVAASLASLGAMATRALFEPVCFDPAGFAWAALGPGVGLVLAALTGDLVGRIVPRPGRAAAAAVGVVVGPFVAVAYELYATSAVFVFSVFAGHFPGPIYDEHQDLPTTLLTYRALSGLLLLALVLGGGAGGLRSRASRVLARTCAGICMGGFALLTLAGAFFGHRTTVARIDAALGAIHRSDRCVLHVPSELSAARARSLGRECDAHVRGIERALRVHRSRPVHVFVHRDAREKGELMGARDTYVAKPWRGEVHVQLEAFPHAVLRHELVHVLMAELTPGPLHVGGRYLGLASNPALVEGLAVALGDEVHDGLGTDQQARALLEVGRLPSVRGFDGAGFLGDGPHVSYVAAGSFTAFLLRHRGVDAVARMLRRGSFGAALRDEAAWHRALRSTPVPAAALETVRLRALDRGLVSTRCARLRATLEADAADALAKADFHRVRSDCARLGAIAPRDPRVLALRAEIALREGRGEGAVATTLRELNRLSAPRPLEARLRRMLGDALVIGHRGAPTPATLDRAAAEYRTALSLGGSEDTRRALEVRLHVLGLPVDERNLVFRALVDRSTESPSEASVLTSLASAATTSPMVRYLLARRLAAAGDAEAALDLLEVPGEGLPPLASLEAARMRARLAVQLALEAEPRAIAARAAARARALPLVEALRPHVETRAEADRLASLLAGASAPEP